MTVREFLKDKKILVVGAGTTGKSIVEYLIREGHEFQIFDEKVGEISGFPVISEINEKFEVALVSTGWQKNHEIKQLWVPTNK
jgi:UDP-N-acetylmuramoylalanine-D-glutamate ligase